MASKKNQEIVTMSSTDIADSLVQNRMELQKAEFTHAVKGLDKPSEIKDLRKKIARLETEKRGREMKDLSEAQLAKRSKIRARRSK
ncbi:MAG: 50S ribosomal protein L29 [Saprospiraceae bacterium]